jgi:hypothetical protein
MIALDDDLLTALRAARPALSDEPPALSALSASPEAAVMLVRILEVPRDPRPRMTRRRLLLAGVPAAAAAVAAAAVAVAASGPGSTRPTVSGVRAAVLDAFEQDSGDIVYATRTIRRPKGPVVTHQAWTYPAFAVPGQRVRFRLFQFSDGVPVQDTESVYTQDAASASLSLSTTQGPRTAEITDVQYRTQTWSRQQSSSVLLAGSLSPSLIRDQIASGHFTVIGPVELDGRRAVELTWSTSPGRLTVTTTLWMDAGTYFPLRSVAVMRAPLGNAVLETDTTHYQILPATPANLSLLTPPIPAGFTRTAKSPNFP